MSNVSSAEAARNFMLSSDIFEHPNLDIYTQMACIVLQYYSGESAVPTLDQIARQGRMNARQTARALQSLVDLKILSHKMFRQIVGEFTDDRLSWAAKGLYAFCKEHPHMQLGELLELTSQSSEDEHSVRKALRELNRYGYLDELQGLKKMVN